MLVASSKAFRSITGSTTLTRYIDMTNTIAVNLATGLVLEFAEDTGPEYAVAFGYYVHTMNEPRKFFAWCQDAADNKTKPEWLNGPLHYGFDTVAMGDWCAKLPDEHPDKRPHAIPNVELEEDNGN
jgi:hypothetical protein